MKILFKSVSFKKFIAHCSQLSLVLLCLVAVGVNLFFTILFQYILFPDTSSNNFDLSLIVFLSIIFIIPFVETLFFQGFLIGYFTKNSIRYELLACLISSFLFAIAHYYSPAYFLKTFISGFCYSLLYIVASRKISYPLIPVMIAHSIFNLIGFLIQYVL